MLGPWLLAAALALALTVAVAVAVRQPRPPLGRLLPVGALVAAAATVRVVFGIWGPLHVNGQGPLWIRGVFEPSELVAYGPGYGELFGWVARHAAEPDVAVFAFNVALSSLAPPLVVAIGRLAGLPSRAALAAGVVVAADPTSARIAATESYFTAIVTLGLLTQWLLLLAATAWARGRRSGAVLAAVAAGLFSAAAARIHPCAYLPLALAPLVVLGAAGLRTWRVRIALCGAATGVVAAAVGITSGTVVLSVLALIGAPSSHPRAAVASRFDLLGALLLVGLLAWTVRRRVRAPWLGPFGLASLGAMLWTRTVYGQHPLWQLAYDRLFWASVVLAAAAYLPRVIVTPWRAPALAIAVLATEVAAQWPVVSVANTEQLEYRFLRRTFKRMPPGCVVASVNRAGRRTLYIPDYLLADTHGVPVHSVTIGRPADLTSLVVPGSCLLYVRTSLCASAEARELCRAIEAAAPLKRVAVRSLPARSSYEALPYDRAEVEVAVFALPSQASAERQPVVTAPEGPDRPCPMMFTPATAQALFAELKTLRASDGCRLDGLQTDRSRMVARFRGPGGALYEVRIVPRACAEDSPDLSGAFVLQAPEAFGRECPDTLRSAANRLAPTAPPGSD